MVKNVATSFNKSSERSSIPQALVSSTFFRILNALVEFLPIKTFPSNYVFLQQLFTEYQNYDGFGNFVARSLKSDEQL